jgi:hypothetical protein
MEFVLLAAIFLTSSGFLVGAAVAPTPTVASAPAADPASWSEPNAPLIQQLTAPNAAQRERSHDGASVCDPCAGST